MAAITSHQSDRELAVTRSFRAPLALVWRLWADTDLRAQWWGPEGFTCVSLEQDFRPGGQWRAHIFSDAEGDLHASGTFREIDPQKLLRFTFRWHERPGEEAETIATVTFEHRHGRTVQHFHQMPFQSLRSRDGHSAGWNSSFNRLAAIAESFDGTRT